MTMLNKTATYEGVVKVTYPDNGDTKEIEVNFEELNRKEVAKVDNMYPDLNAQAGGGIQAIERIKEEMVLDVDLLFNANGLQIIYVQLDAILNRVLTEDNDNERVWYREIAADVYDLVHLSKKLLDLYQGRKGIAGNVRHIEYAQKGILI